MSIGVDVKKKVHAVKRPVCSGKNRLTTHPPAGTFRRGEISTSVDRSPSGTKVNRQEELIALGWSWLLFAEPGGRRRGMRPPAPQTTRTSPPTRRYVVERWASDPQANQNALQLQEEIVNTENKLTFAKQACNDSIETYNATKKSVFPAMVVAVFRNLNVPFEYWQLSQDAVADKEKYTVQL